MSSEQQPARFEEDLAFGLQWEELATQRLEDLLLSVRAKNVDYADRPELQQAGIDTIVTSEQPTFDIKCQRHEYVDSGNLPIEMHSVLEKGVLGWFYTSDADLIVWVYPNKAATNLHHTGYLMPLHDHIRGWVQENAADWPRFERPNDGQYGEYTTAGRLAPIADFPAEYLVEFDPRLPTDRETPQSDILTWAGGSDQEGSR